MEELSVESENGGKKAFLESEAGVGIEGLCPVQANATCVCLGARIHDS